MIVWPAFEFDFSLIDLLPSNYSLGLEKKQRDEIKPFFKGTMAV